MYFHLKYACIIMSVAVGANEFEDRIVGGGAAGLAGVAALALLSLAAPAVSAPSAPGATVEGVTVTAPQKDADQLPDRVFRFVQAHGVPGRIDQLSRWAAPLCPKTEGLPPAFNAFVSARVSQVARAVGVPAARGRPRNFACRTNVLVVFTTQPQTLMDNVRKEHPQMLGFHYAAQAQRLAVFNGPAQAWYMTGTSGRGGVPQADTEFGAVPGGQAGSRLSVRLTSQFMGVLVVVDSNRIVGRQIGAIADQAAMLALARAAPGGGCSSLPTILDALNPDCGAARGLGEMSVYDVAYLKGLYSVDPEEFLSAQRSEIGSHMMRDLQTPAAEAAKP
jgi:hypothetical protein